MEVINALFNPHGTVRGTPYWIGALVLIIVAAVVQYISFAAIVNAEDMSGLMMSSIVGLLIWFLIYPYFCLYGKRFRDIGHPATWFVLALVVYAIINSVAQMIVSLPAMAGEMEGVFNQLEGVAESTEGDAVPYMSSLMNTQVEMQKSIVKKTMWPALMAGAMVSATFSGILGVLKPKLEGNPFTSNKAAFD